MGDQPSRPAVEWVENAVEARVVSWRGLRDDRGPWLLRFDGGGGAVLRIAAPDDALARRLLRTEVAALRVVREHDLAGPRLLAADLDGHHAVLTTVVPGSSTIPVTATPERLRALGAAAAALHAIDLEPSEGLPVRTRPIGSTDFDALRRRLGTTPMLAEAQELMATLPRPSGSVFVHGDLWQGNVLWADDAITGFVDWDCAGSGHPGVDLGSLRFDVALMFEPDAMDEVSAGWAAVTGRAPADEAYWDVMAALSSPPDLGWFVTAIAGQGRADVDRATGVRRREEFLAAALRRLRAAVG